MQQGNSAKTEQQRREFLKRFSLQAKLWNSFWYSTKPTIFHPENLNSRFTAVVNNSDGLKLCLRDFSTTTCSKVILRCKVSPEELLRLRSGQKCSQHIPAGQNCFGITAATTPHWGFVLTQTNTCADASPHNDLAREDYPAIYGVQYSIKAVKIRAHATLILNLHYSHLHGHRDSIFPLSLDRLSQEALCFPVR